MTHIIGHKLTGPKFCQCNNNDILISMVDTGKEKARKVK